MQIHLKLIVLLIVLSLFSCKKVIDIELRDTEVKYVIEGIITNEPGVCKVYISQSKLFNEDNQFDKISGATVKIKDNATEVLLAESQPGLYAI